MKPTRTWILIADGARGKVLLHEGPGRGLRALEGLDFSEDVPPTRDIDADRPGRSFDSHGEGRHAMEPPSDPHRQRKEAFARRLAEVLVQGCRRNDFDQLVVVAPPSALGDLRNALAPEVKARVKAELPKDLTRTDMTELPRHLETVLAV